MCITRNFIGGLKNKEIKPSGFHGTWQTAHYISPCVWSAHGYVCPHVCAPAEPTGSCRGICLPWEWRVALCVVTVIGVASSPCNGRCWLNSVSINTKIKRLKNCFGVTVLFCIISQAAGWGCCHGDAATEECGRGRGRWQRQEEIQHAQEREICSSGKADQAGSPDRQSRYDWVTDWIAVCYTSNKGV